MEQLTAKFNSHLAGKIITIVNEGMFGGNIQDRNKLKDMITSYIQNVENKGKDIIQIENFMNFMLTTNCYWSAPVEEGNRRFFYTEIYNTWAKGGDKSDEERKAYFKRLTSTNAPKPGTLNIKAVAKFLYEYDISNFDPEYDLFKFPELQKQCELGWDTAKGFWNDCLKFNTIGEFEFNGVYNTECSANDPHQYLNNGSQSYVGFKSSGLCGVLVLLEHFNRMLHSIMVRACLFCLTFRSSQLSAARYVFRSSQFHNTISCQSFTFQKSFQ